jgi:CTP synthase
VTLVGKGRLRVAPKVIKTKHPWFVAGQFHPELKSTVETPHPLFVRFVKAAIQHKKGL